MYYCQRNAINRLRQQKTRLCLRKETSRSRLRLLQIAKKITTLKHYLNVIVVDVQELMTLNDHNLLFIYNKRFISFSHKMRFIKTLA